MKRFLIFLLPLLFIGCSALSPSDSFVTDVWKKEGLPDDICRYVSPDYEITQFQQDPRVQGESCQSVIATLQEGARGTRGLATSLISPGRSVALICTRDPFADKLAILSVILREGEGKIKEIHISPQTRLRGKSDWQETRGIRLAAERARSELPEKCQELEVFGKS